MKPVAATSNTYVEYSKQINNKHPKFKIGDTVRISKYKIFFAKVTLQIGLKKFLWLRKLKILCRGHILFVILTTKKLLERFMKII